jgi:hypothetical protein
MSGFFTQLMEKDPTKYPAKMGKPWAEEEVVQLLASIKKQKTIEDIAIEQQRTVGGINAQLKRMAAEYYMNDGRTIEEIGKFTGLTSQQINDAIKKYSEPKVAKNLVVINEPPPVKNTIVIESKEPDEVIAILKDIRDKLDLIMKKMN